MATASEACYQAIETKYLGPTDTKGSRVKASTESGQSRIIPWDDARDSETNHRIGAIALCHKMQWSGHLVGGAVKRGYVWVFLPDAPKGRGRHDD